MRRSIALVTAAAACLAFQGGAQADVITHFGSGAGTGIPALLTTSGVGAGNPGVETTAETFIVPGASGTTVDLTFGLTQDTGAYQFSFGFFDINDVMADPLTDKTTWAAEALSSATLVFDDRTSAPGDTVTISGVSAGDEIGFFLLPDNTLAEYLSPSWIGSGNLEPLFSVANANPGEYDQMMSFIGNGVTLFTFEDLSRNGASDEDFTDLAFTINVEVGEGAIPTQQIAAPPVLSLLAVGAAAISGGLVRNRTATRPA